ncbi:MAG: putative metal-binding protein [Sulfitobacter sp.]|jgi:predicted metal-binding protein
MGLNTSNRITVCTSCRHKGTDCRPGYELIAKLRSAIDAAGDTVDEDFEISGVACMAGCDRPCTVAYHGTRKATYLFGDIEPDEDIEDLVNFARQYALLHDGWCSSVDRPGKLRTSTLARVPAAMIAIEQSESLVS